MQLFNYAKAAELGYRFPRRHGFISGDFNKTTVSWRGNENLDWIKMKKVINKNNSKLTVHRVDKAGAAPLGVNPPP